MPPWADGRALWGFHGRDRWLWQGPRSDVDEAEPRQRVCVVCVLLATLSQASRSERNKAVSVTMRPP